VTFGDVGATFLWGDWAYGTFLRCVWKAMGFELRAVAVPMWRTAQVEAIGSI